MNQNLYKIASPFAGFLGKHPELILYLKYFRSYHRMINLKEPELFHDKIIWMSLFTDTFKWSELADKYAVRNYVKNTIGDKYLTKLYGVYSNPDDIDFDALPKQFVLKTNNGCTSNIIVRDKSKLNIEDAKSRLRYWMNIPYGELSGQPHYTRIYPKRIIAEELLVQPECPDKSLYDYKFNCFNGVPVSCVAYPERVEGTHLMSKMIYDMDWNPHPEYYDKSKPVKLKILPKPNSFEEMKIIASKLSQGFPFVRVDLYSIGDNPIFGELTFTPGIDAYYSLDYQKKLGDMIKLPISK